MDWHERIESLKAGLFGLMAAGLTVGLTTLIGYGVQLNGSGSEPLLSNALVSLESLISGAIALLSGFLFGVTYRYIIRSDRNPHLKSGAILAFGLVRGLAQIDVGFSAHSHPWLLMIGLGESMLMFAIAQILLDWAIAMKWVKSF